MFSGSNPIVVVKNAVPYSNVFFTITYAAIP